MSSDGRFYWDGQRWAPMPTEVKKGMGVGSCLLAGVGSLALIMVFGLCAAALGGPGESVTVKSWRAGDSYVTGTFQNGGTPCSHLEVHLKSVDHNGAVVDEATIPVGDVAAKATGSWSGHFTELLGGNHDLSPVVTAVNGSLYCADQR